MDRIGGLVFTDPMVRGAQNRPTGQYQFFYYWRVGGGVLNADAARLLGSSSGGGCPVSVPSAALLIRRPETDREVGSAARVGVVAVGRPSDDGVATVLHRPTRTGRFACGSRICCRAPRRPGEDLAHESWRRIRFASSTRTSSSSPLQGEPNKPTPATCAAVVSSRGVLVVCSLRPREPRSRHLGRDDATGAQGVTESRGDRTPS